ncbi:MAG: nucleotidyltransferase domain-containing protein [Candidatus Paracaedibacteraceae bacterium]|nr:nucleotidyltransferase domain-containing protein [Candidatus Paracaedibacteraceae bacterium]
MPLHLTENEYTIVRQIIHNVLPSSACVYVFGSRVNHTCKPFSDLDLAIDLGRALTEVEMLNLKDAFDGAALIFKVDIVDLYNISSSFKESIEPNLISLFH